MTEILSLKALRVHTVQISFLKKINMNISKNDCIVTKVLIMALSPGGGMSNDFVVVMGKYSQNN